MCMSRDSLISQDWKLCAQCPFNDFGSKDGESNAKACKESALLFLLRSQSSMPLFDRVPMTSKPRFLRYMTRLVVKETNGSPKSMQRYIDVYRKKSKYELLDHDDTI